MENTVKEPVWTTANGVQKPFSQIDQQHLSNILWYHEVIHNVTRFNNYIMSMIHNELVNRFNGERLLWKPLPISGEVAWLRRNGFLRGTDIVKMYHTDTGFQTRVIGTIDHIDTF
jgi:hypothetical protein